MKRILGIVLAVLFTANIVFAQESQDRFFVLQDFSGGQNSHISPLVTPDNQAVDAQNVRVNGRYAALTKREPLITAWDTGSATNNTLHRYYKSDGTFKTLIATSTYLDIGSSTDTTTTHIDSALSDGKRWQFATFKDVAIGTNGYNNPIKYDGKTTTTTDTDGARTAGELCADLGAPFAELNTGSNLTASKWYQYKVMYLVGALTYYSNARSNPIVTGSTVRDIYLTDIPIGPTGTTARYIYRTLGKDDQATVEDTTTFYLTATISDNTTRVYADITTDAALAGNTAWSTTSKYNSTPPKGKYCTVNKERLWIGGNTTYKSDLYFSDDGNPDFFGPDDFFAIRADDGDEITFIKTLTGILVVGKNNSIQKLYTDGSFTTDWYASDPFSFVGCPAPYTADTSPIGIIYLARNGLYVFDGVRSNLISDAVTPEINDISHDSLANCAGLYFNNEYRLSYTSYASGVSYNNKVLIYNLVRNAYVVDTINANCWTAFNSSTDTGVIYLGSSLSDGLIKGTTYTEPLLNIRYDSEFDAGTYDDTRTSGTENSPVLELGWDCTFATWLTELQTKSASINTLADIETYLPDAVIARPDTSGTWVSPVYYINASALNKLYWNEILGPYGNITLQVRLNSSSDMSGISYETAVSDPNGSDMSGITANSYIQFRANLSTTDTAYSPELYQADGYVFRLTYDKVGSTKESAVTSLWRSGWKDFGIPGYKKMIKRIKVFYSGTSGTVSFNIKCDDGDIDKTFDINLNTSANYSTTDEYTGDENLKVYTAYPPINSSTEPSLISQLFRFLITENGVVGWEINKIEIQYSVENLY